MATGPLFEWTGTIYCDILNTGPSYQHSVSKYHHSPFCMMPNAKSANVTMEWLTDDPELLDAALCMLVGDEHVDGYQDTQLRSVAIPFDDGPSQTKRQRTNSGSTTKVVNLSRERQRKELITLRQDAVELETKLEALQLRRDQQLRPFLTANGEANSVAVYWEAIAKRQFRERKRSEMLNSKLKAMRDTQLRVAEDLITAIRHAEEQSMQINAEGMIVEKPRVRLAIDVSQKISEEDQLQRLEMLCTQCEEAFTRSPKMADPSCIQFMDVHSYKDESGDLILDAYASSAFPYPIKLVDEVLWKFYLAESAEEDGHTFAQDYKSTSDDNIIGIFEASTIVQGLRAVFNGKYVAKRIVDDKGRLTIAFHSFCVGQQSDRPEKAEMDEDSWIRIIDAADIGLEQLGSQLTLLQHVRRCRVGFSGLEATKDSSAGLQEDRRKALIEYLKLQIEDEMLRGEQALENMMLDAAKTESSRSK